MLDLAPIEMFLAALLFIWAGFVLSGLDAGEPTGFVETLFLTT